MSDSYNSEKSREVYCPYCKETTISNKPAPYCEKCNHELITVVKSAIEIKQSE